MVMIYVIDNHKNNYAYFCAADAEVDVIIF